MQGDTEAMRLDMVLVFVPIPSMQEMLSKYLCNE